MDGLSGLIIVLCVAGSLLLAAVNYSLRTFNRVQLQDELRRRRREHLLELLPRRLDQWVLASATLRIAFNVALLLALSYALRGWAARNWAVHLLLVGLLGFAVILLFSVAIPNAWARYAGDSLLARALPAVRLLGRLLAPVTTALHGMDELVRRLAGAPRDGEDAEHVERDILSAVDEGEREGVVDAQERQMIRSVLDFQDTRADQIMTPRTEIIAADAASDLPTVLAAIRRAGHSRIPVYQDNLDNIVGVLYAKDLLWRLGESLGVEDTTERSDTQRPASSPQNPASSIQHPTCDIRKVMRPPLFVPESRPISDLLNDLRRRKVHLAIVLDEFGGTAGLVTVEDILEEIVGEIADEHDLPEPPLIRRIDESTLEVDGRVHVDDLNEQFNLSLPEDEDYDTIGGLVISALGHIPKAGEKLDRDNLTITVTQAEPRRINRLRLHVAPPPPENP